MQSRDRFSVRALGHMLPAPVARADLGGAAPWARTTWADCVMAEVHLDPAVTRVDALAAWMVRPEERLAAASLWASPILAEARFGAATPMVWVEWDEARGWEAPPLEFLCVTDRILGDASPQRPPADGRRRWDWVADALVALWGAPPAAVARAAEAVEVMGAAASLMHVATLRPRGAEVIRLGFHGDPAGLLRALEALRWPGPLDDVAAVLAAAQGDGDVGVQLDLAPDWTPYIGVELAEHRAPSPARAAAQGAWLSRLAAVDDARWSAFAGWHGAAPGGLRHGHAKLAFVEGRWVAKAYFGWTTQEVVDTMVRAARRGVLLRG